MFPKIQSAKTIDSHTLLIKFDNNKKKQYDIRPLLKNKIFAPLTNQALFKAVQVEQGGYAITWNENIDISEYELWNSGYEYAEQETEIR